MPRHRQSQKGTTVGRGLRLIILAVLGALTVVLIAYLLLAIGVYIATECLQS